MSVKIDQALINAILNAGLAMDIVREGGSYSIWGGSSYSHKRGTYEPSSSREYADIVVFPAGSEPYTLDGNTSVHTGLLQCTLYHPINTGAIAAKAAAQAVSAALRPGSIAAYNGQDVEIMRDTISNGRTEGGFYVIVVRSYYRAFVSN